MNNERSRTARAGEQGWQTDPAKASNRKCRNGELINQTASCECRRERERKSQTSEEQAERVNS
eukprot:4068340-Pleurochrysis_carterae.AAC.1